MNSLAIRSAVNKSSAACACAFSGISRFNTGIKASIFISKAGRLEVSSPAASCFSMYSLALKSISRKSAAVVIRLESFLSRYIRLGFSPKAHFIATPSRTTISSTLLPTVLIVVKVPPSTFALPGPTQTQVTPAAAAFRNAGSMGFTPSIPLICGHTISFNSL